MKKAGQNNGTIIIDDKFIGVSLGFDFTAEHEWGIKGIKRNFGIPESTKRNMGIKSRTITKCSPLIFKEETHKKNKFALLYSGLSWRSVEENEKYTPSDLENYVSDLEWTSKWIKDHPNEKNRENIVTAWDEDGFGIGLMGEKDVQYLKELKVALENKNVTIAFINLTPNNPFSRASLSILISDRIPEEARKEMFDADKELFDRIDYEKKIGMKKIIEKHGNKNGYQGDKYFMACSPKWIDYDDDENREAEKKKYNTKYNIMYWVNYSDNDNNSGWYSVEEIREWLTGNKKLSEIRKG